MKKLFLTMQTSKTTNNLSAELALKLFMMWLTNTPIEMCGITESWRTTPIRVVSSKYVYSHNGKFQKQLKFIKLFSTIL